MFVSHEAGFDGLLSAVAWCLRRRAEHPVLLSAGEEPLLLPVEPVTTEPEIRAFFARHYTRRLGEAVAREFLDRAFRAYLAEQDGMATRLYRYFYLGWLLGLDPSAQLQDKDIAAVVQAAARTGMEAHRYLGLLRFRMLEGDCYLAEFAPDCHVLPLILPHFMDRLPDQCFVICDRRRLLAACYQPGRGCSIHRIAEQAEPDGCALADAISLLPDRCTVLNAGSEADGGYARLWVRYLQHLTLPERRNLRLQRQNLPLKVRAYLTECGSTAPEQADNPYRGTVLSEQKLLPLAGQQPDANS